MALHHRLPVLCASAGLILFLACGGSPSASTSGGTPNPPPSPAGLKVTGTLAAPVSATATLLNNGADGISVTVPTASDGVAYNRAAFTFSTALASGSSYSVTVNSAPAGQVCSVYSGSSGTVPATGATNVLVGCEYIWDLISRSSDSTVIDNHSSSGAPVIGGSDEAIGKTTTAYGEGRAVVFVSYKAGLAGNSNGYRQVFWRDRYTGKTYLVSANASGAEGDASSSNPAISADGLTVVFESAATNLVAGDTNRLSDVFVWSALNPTGGVQRLSVNASGVEGNGASSAPVVSGDGNVVSFVTYANNFSAGLSGSVTPYVYRLDRSTGVFTLVTVNTSGAPTSGREPAISEDGNRIAFWSYASDIVAGDTNGAWDIFLYDHTTGVRSLVSRNSSGVQRNTGTESVSRIVTPGISGNGRFVAYPTTSTNLVSGDSNGYMDVFVCDTQTGNVVCASVSSQGAQGNADSGGGRPVLSYDGTWVAFTTAATNLETGGSGVLIHNNMTGETRAVTDAAKHSGVSIWVAMSRKATYVTFDSGDALDSRFTSSGAFVRYTGLNNAFFW